MCFWYTVFSTSFIHSFLIIQGSTDINAVTNFLLPTDTKYRWQQMAAVVNQEDKHAEYIKHAQTEIWWSGDKRVNW